MTNGFDDKIVSNPENKTFLPATKANADRFEESFNGVPLITAKTAIRYKKVGELGVSYMGGVYNKFEDDGLVLDERRSVNVFALDFNTTIPLTKLWINTEWAWVNVDVPETYSQQYGSKQQGGFIDFVQPIVHSTFGFKSLLSMLPFEWSMSIGTGTTLVRRVVDQGRFFLYRTGYELETYFENRAQAKLSL